MTVSHSEAGASSGHQIELSPDQLVWIKRVISGPETFKPVQAAAARVESARVAKEVAEKAGDIAATAEADTALADAEEAVRSAHEGNYQSIRRRACLEDFYRDHFRTERLAGRQPMPESEFWWQRISNPPDRNVAIAEALQLWHPEHHEDFPAPTAELLEAAMLAAVQAYADWPKVVEAELEKMIVSGWEAERQWLRARTADAGVEAAPADSPLAQHKLGGTELDDETLVTEILQLMTAGASRPEAINQVYLRAPRTKPDTADKQVKARLRGKVQRRQAGA